MNAVKVSIEKNAREKNSFKKKLVVNVIPFALSLKCTKVDQNAISNLRKVTKIRSLKYL